MYLNQIKIPHKINSNLISVPYQKFLGEILHPVEDILIYSIKFIEIQAILSLGRVHNAD